MKSLTISKMESLNGGINAKEGIMCGLAVVGWGVSLVSLIAAPNPLSAIGYSVSTASLAGCFV